VSDVHKLAGFVPMTAEIVSDAEASGRAVEASEKRRRAKLGRIQAKHIPDEAIMGAVATVNAEGRWAMTWDLADALPGVPPKVILAKCRSLIKRGRLTGCACGCRGDFEIAMPTS